MEAARLKRFKHLINQLRKVHDLRDALHQVKQELERQNPHHDHPLMSIVLRYFRELEVVRSSLDLILEDHYEVEYEQYLMMVDAF